MNYWTQSKKNIFVAAHRGWCAKYPENTMEAFRAALTLDIDQIETDVRITKDGHLVLIHDATVDRTTNGTGKVCDMTLEELKQLDAGSWKGSEFAGCRVPTLIELMELVKDHPTLTLDLELKEYPNEGWEEVSYSVADRVFQVIADYGFEERFFINTFSGKLHEYIRGKYGDRYKQHVYYPQYHMTPCETDPYSYAYALCVFGVEKGTVTTEEVRKLHEQTGVIIGAGAYVKDEATVDMAVEMGSELITCNNPDEVLQILRNKGLHR